MRIIAPCQLLLGINKNKQTSYKVLTGLIVLMFALQTIRSVCEWYIVWRGFIYYTDAPDLALDALEGEKISFLIHVVESLGGPITVLKLDIADSILVSTRVSIPTDTTNSLPLKRSGYAGSSATAVLWHHVFL
jgi:hypothetical protein